MAEEKKTQQETPGSLARVAKNVVRNGAVLEVTEEDNEFEAHIKGPMPGFQQNYVDNATMKVVSKRSKVKVKQRNSAQESSSEQQSTSCTGRRQQQVAKNVLREGAVMDVEEEDNQFIVEVEGSNINVVKNEIGENAAMKGSCKRDTVKVTQKRLPAQETSSKQQSTSCTETATGDQHLTVNEAVKAAKPQSHVIVCIESLAKQEKFNYRFQKSDKVKIMRDVIREKIGQEGEYQLFNNDKTKLREEQSFEQNGIQTNDTITVATEQYVECGGVPRGYKA